jgi:hypothetical protein
MSVHHTKGADMSDMSMPGNTDDQSMAGAARDEGMKDNSDDQSMSSPSEADSEMDEDDDAMSGDDSTGM